ncbi:hypothetical protein FOA52_003907 [Chlamydomonas sp. UWO 241]|nr:hypothetical protein FOA52_003907 [Chlamydomonas sp. UWO 241]
MKCAPVLAALCALALLSAAAVSCSTCSGTPPTGAPHDYSPVLGPETSAGIDFLNLPGFTRSVYKRDYGLITPESRVWNTQPGWSKSVTSHLISKGSGAHFVMFLARMSAGAVAGTPAPGTERFVFVLDGEVQAGGVTLAPNQWAYFPPNATETLTSTNGAGVVLFERTFSLKASPVFATGDAEDSPLLPTTPEVFKLRKLLPTTVDYDFNVHLMDFNPGEYLIVKEVHYNQHGLLLLEGQGIYRLADDWYPVQAGDAIYMAPYVTQWYAALGNKPSRYLLYKDTTVDPLHL